LVRLGSGKEGRRLNGDYNQLALFTLDEVERAAHVFSALADELAAVVTLAKVEAAMQEEPEAVVE